MPFVSETDTWQAICPRCHYPYVGANYGRLCGECRDDLREKAASYGGDQIDIDARAERLIAAALVKTTGALFIIPAACL